jgi:hypothetical protein
MPCVWLCWLGHFVDCHNARVPSLHFTRRNGIKRFSQIALVYGLPDGTTFSASTIETRKTGPLCFNAWWRSWCWQSKKTFSAMAGLRDFLRLIRCRQSKDDKTFRNGNRWLEDQPAVSKPKTGGRYVSTRIQFKEAIWKPNSTQSKNSGCPNKLS